MGRFDRSSKDVFNRQATDLTPPQTTRLNVTKTEIFKEEETFI